MVWLEFGLADLGSSFGIPAVGFFFFFWRHSTMSPSFTCRRSLYYRSRALLFPLPRLMSGREF